ncbi:MAG TPA: 2Fe-2S iron-sulfur cluster-binding protein [Alphaproteobacteria bacterium]|nr:2Fe-2S iron-sulfur cluster-binding protein [Alphaproteobacteria bacterium]
MAFTVNIRGHDRPIAVEEGQTVLEAALSQGVPYPHGCQSGNCGACKSRLYDGEIELSPYSEYALTAEEKSQGLILACRAVPWSDAEVGWLAADEIVAHPLRLLECRVVEVESVTHDVKCVRFEILAGGPFVFSAGQYARVVFEGQPARDYSMANRLDQSALEFHIRHVEGGASSSYVATHLKVGERVRVEGPYGTAHFRESHSGPILAIAGGSGLAPIKSIVETALQRSAAPPIHLYFGVRDVRDLYLEAHFRTLEARHANFRFTPVLSQPSGPTARRTGFVHEAVGVDFPEFDGFKAYIAGPPVMVEAASALLSARGMRREDIHADAFYTEAEKAMLQVPV